MIEPIVSAAGAGLLIGWIAVDSFTYRDTITPRSWGYAINLGMAFVAGMAMAVGKVRRAWAQAQPNK